MSRFTYSVSHHLLQCEFAEFVAHAEKAKESLKESLAALTAA